MEGTDATIARAGEIMWSLSTESEPASVESEPAGDASTLSRALTVVKMAKPAQDMRFDVPVIGVATIEAMKRAGASCLAIDAGRCLLLDGDGVMKAADEVGICLIAE